MLPDCWSAEPYQVHDAFFCRHNSGCAPRGSLWGVFILFRLCLVSEEAATVSMLAGPPPALRPAISSCQESPGELAECIPCPVDSLSSLGPFARHVDSLSRHHLVLYFLAPHSGGPQDPA